MEVAVQAIDGRTKDGIKKIKQQFIKSKFLIRRPARELFWNETILAYQKIFRRPRREME